MSQLLLNLLAVAFAFAVFTDAFLLDTLRDGIATREPVVKADTFTAAVYEHAVYLPALGTNPLTRDLAVSEMMPNLRVFQTQTREAAEQGADIIVFPEDGIYGMAFSRNRSLVFPFLEYMPDPNTINWNPCSDPHKYPDVDVQVHLSCMAKENKIYLVANFGDKQSCDNLTDPLCPSDGRYQFNTDVAYDPSGKFIAKYHKYNLFYEFQFDTPKQFDAITFDTPFGKFGMFTCFDIIFENPPVDLVQRHNITNIAFPTAWMDAGPFFTSVQFHSSFAMAHGVNFLAANIHLPAADFHGSGIYTPDGAATYYYNTSLSSPGRLMVKTIPIVTSHIDLQYDPVLDPVDEPTDENFKAVLFKDEYTCSPLLDTVGQASVCNNEFCCNVSYNGHVQGDNSSASYVGKDVLPKMAEFYAIATYNDLHRRARYYLQICMLVKCRTDEYGNATCGDNLDDVIDDAYNQTTVFPDVETFTLYGNFSTSYVYPQIFLGDADDVSLTSYPRTWSYADGYLRSHVPLNEPLGVASLIGRDYTRDIPL